MTIEYLKENNLILYEYVRGSWAHGIGIEGVSDIDIGGVFYLPLDNLLGLNSNYVEQVSDKKGDVVYYEFGRWIELLLKSNPTVLESLFVDEKFVRIKHSIIQKIIENRDMFLTKECFKPTFYYAMAQIQKARGLNKKINLPEDFQRKDILDFCYTFKQQGSQPIKDFLTEHYLDQRYSGLVKVPNMYDTYGVYYDFAAYFKFENITTDTQTEILNSFMKNPGAKDVSFVRFDIFGSDIQYRIATHNFFHYKGIVEPENIQKSNEVRLSSIPKNETPICFMTYNKTAYELHCKEHKEWTEWKKNRNPIRYESNKEKNYDAKNMCECVRLLHTGIDVLTGKGFIVERTEDRDFLLSIKQHNFEYDEIISYVEKKKDEFEKLYQQCTLPEKINSEQVNTLLVDIRKKLYRIK